MLALVIFLCYVTFVTAFMPFVDVMQRNAIAAENLLNETQLRFDEELAQSLLKALEVIMIIPNKTEYLRTIILLDTIYIVNKVDMCMVKPARESGLNTTECKELSVKFVEAANNVMAKKTFCAEKIVNSTGRYMKSIEKLADDVHRNFTTWRAKIREVTSVAVNSESPMLAYTTIHSILENAITQMNNYRHKLRRKIVRIEETGTEHAAEDCLRTTEEYFNYQTEYWSLPDKSKKCIEAMVQTMESFKPMEIVD